MVETAMERKGRKTLSVKVTGIATIAICAVFFTAVASAQTRVVKRDVTGTGLDEQEAVLNALQEATFQICGVRIESTTETGSVLIEDDNRTMMVENVNRQIKVRGKNPNCGFDGYDVLSVGHDGSKARASVRVRYSVYRVPGPPMKRRRISVIDFPMDQVHLYGVGAGRQQRSDGTKVREGIDVDFRLIRNLQEGFRAKMEELLTQSRRFGVLDRKRQDVYDAERRLLQSSDVSVQERARLGKVLGADYMLYGTVHRVLVEDRSETIRLTGERINQVYGTADVRFTVLAVPTRQVKWSSSMTVEKTSEAGSFRPEDFAHALLDDVAARVVDELTENIYPPKVAKVLGQGQFVVNRGGNTVEPGDIFEVFALGDWVTDPDTGEKLDRIEISVGIAKIMSVKPKYSLAQLISETASLSNGMVLRRRRVEDSGMGSVAPPERNKPSFSDEDGDGLPDYLNRSS
jgi:curli biogenesis system outer membrane secretion channel CsgG